MLENKVRKDRLYETYRGLLTERQTRVMDQFLRLDYSPVEIAENLSVSRQAVHDTIKKTTAALEEFEQKLGCMRRSMVCEEFMVKVTKFAEETDNQELMEILKLHVV